MIYYDGYLDRSRLGPNLYASGSLYSKRFFTDISTVINKNDNKNNFLNLGFSILMSIKN